MWIPLVVVAARLGVSKRTIYNRMADAVDPFPQPSHIGAAVRWDEREVEAWVVRQKRAATTDAPRKRKPASLRRTA